MHLRPRSARMPEKRFARLAGGLLLLIFAPIANAQEQTDAISREITVYNDLVNPVFASSAISRELTVYNDIVNPISPTDAVSREIVVFKYQQLVTSSGTAHAWPIPGVLPDQLSQINSGPPAFEPDTWLPVAHRNTNTADPFVCFEVPDPLDDGYVVSTSYVLDAGEVTLDNCGSAFYHYTFTLPEGASGLRLRGVANCTQEGVLFLNDHQVSGTLFVPPCVPQHQNDPCYLAQDTGFDDVDAMGRPLLTSPTPDLFDTSAQSYFVIGGVNELVFGICGDASYFDPTGIEFYATLEYTFPQPVVPGDCNSNAQVNLEDYAVFADCLAGPGLWPGSGCACSNLDADGDVDLFDYALFQVAVTQ